MGLLHLVDPLRLVDLQLEGFDCRHLWSGLLEMVVVGRRQEVVGRYGVLVLLRLRLLSDKDSRRSARRKHERSPVQPALLREETTHSMPQGFLLGLGGPFGSAGGPAWAGGGPAWAAARPAREASRMDESFIADMRKKE